MLAAEGDEVADGRVVAAFDVPAQELPALREAQRIDRGGGRKDRIRAELVADERDLLSEIADEGGLAVGAGGVAEVNEVDVGSGVCGLGERGDFFHAVALEVVAETVPDNEREGGEFCFMGAEGRCCGEDCEGEGEEAR